MATGWEETNCQRRCVEAIDCTRVLHGKARGTLGVPRLLEDSPTHRPPEFADQPQNPDLSPGALHPSSTRVHFDCCCSKQKHRISSNFTKKFWKTSRENQSDNSDKTLVCRAVWLTHIYSATSRNKDHTNPLHECVAPNWVQSSYSKWVTWQYHRTHDRTKTTL